MYGYGRGARRGFIGRNSIQPTSGLKQESIKKYFTKQVKKTNQTDVNESMGEYDDVMGHIAPTKEHQWRRRGPMGSRNERGRQIGLNICQFGMNYTCEQGRNPENVKVKYTYKKVKIVAY